MLVPAIPPLVAAIASLILAIIVYRRAPDRTIGRVFSFMAITLVFWNLLFVVLYSDISYDVALRLTWVFRCGAIFLLPAILHVVLVFPGRPLSRRARIAVWASYAVAAFLVGLNLAGLLVEKLAHFEWGYYSVNTPYYDLFSAFLALTFTASAAILIREYVTTTQPRMRLQLKLWLVGAGIALPLGLTNLFPVYGLPVYPLGNLGSAIWAGFVGYAVVRYRLFDIELVVTRSLTYVIVSFVIVGPLAFIAIILQRVVFEAPHYDYSFALVLLLLLSGILYAPVRLAIEKRLEAALFPAKVESRAKLRALASQVVRILDRERLLTVLCDDVASAFEVDRVALFLRDDAQGAYRCERSKGSERGLTIYYHHQVIRWLANNPEPLLRDEAASQQIRREFPDLASYFATHGFELCVPFGAGRDLLGFVFLGKRRGLQAFSVQDVDLLKQVAAEAAVALRNAELYAEVRRSREIINRAGRLSAIGTLAAGIAHEIRNPLVSIQTFFQLAPSRLGDEEFMTSFLRIAEKEVHRISHLVADLLTFARSPSAEVTELDVNDVVQRAVKLLDPQARSGRVSIEVVLGTDLYYTMADPDRILQVIVNLVLNAIQASEPGSRVVVSTRAVRVAREAYNEISVRDEGRGMSPEVRESIFDPFFTTKERGTGLGLSICHQLVMEAGGFISVESAPGEGSVFAVHLPAMPSEGQGQVSVGE